MVPQAYHQPGVYRAPDDAPQGVPSAVVEPVVELVETFFGEETRRPEDERARETQFKVLQAKGQNK
jgi:hypothetical protein